VPVAEPVDNPETPRS